MSVRPSVNTLIKKKWLFRRQFKEHLVTLTLCFVFWSVVRERLNYITCVTFEEDEFCDVIHISEKKKGRGEENLFKRDGRKGNRLPQKLCSFVFLLSFMQERHRFFIEISIIFILSLSFLISMITEHLVYKSLCPRVNPCFIFPYLIIWMLSSLYYQSLSSFWTCTWTKFRGPPSSHTHTHFYPIIMKKICIICSLFSLKWTFNYFA